MALPIRLKVFYWMRVEGCIKPGQGDVLQILDSIDVAILMDDDRCLFGGIGLPTGPESCE
jgi:hypothetical protein